MPKIQALHERYGPSGLVVVGIDNPGGDPAATERATAYFTGRGYTYTLLLDGDAVGDAYDVSFLPTLYVIDRNGTIAYRKAGTGEDPANPDERARAFELEITAAIERLLK